jgi:DNA-directed RNA polymerase subunit L
MKFTDTEGSIHVPNLQLIKYSSPFVAMGGRFSKSKALSFHADCVDDSIHYMIAKEERLARKKGVELCGYRPATPHPLLQRHKISVRDEDEDTATEASIGSSLRMNSDKVETKKCANEKCITAVDRRGIPRPHLFFFSGSS